MTKINTILQCFVDLNLELDENSGLELTDLPKISFEQPSYNVEEGQIVDVVVSLESPSVNGLEEVEVGISVNNTSVDDFSTLGETYPNVMTFSAGQQSNTISFLIEEDLFENEVESFDVLLGFFTNTNPGQYITTTINIIDQTDLKEVFISEQGGAIIPGFNIGPVITQPILRFSALEGTSKDVIISLDSPSTLGVESVDVQFENLTVDGLDYSAVGSTNLSWAVGEQTKTLTIQANDDEEIEDKEFLRINLVNPVNSNVSTFSSARFVIFDSSPDFRFSTINFQGIYIQKGDSLPNVEARYIRRNSTSSSVDTTWRMFIRFGDFIEQNYQTFNPPSTSLNAPVCGDNCIDGYDPNQFAQFQQDNKIFFGKNPETEEYGDLRLRIKNIGSHPAKISGVTIAVNGEITVDIDEFDYKIKLPANDALLSGGTFYQGSPLSEDTLTECVYDFTFEVDYEELGFSLRNFDNSVSTIKEFNLGPHRFVETYNSLDSELSQNYHNLVCQYSNIWPYWEENPTFPQMNPYCLPAGSLLDEDPQYPTSSGDLQNIFIDGILFLHQTVANENNPNTNKTQHVNFEFLSNGQKAQDNGCGPVDIQFDSSVFSPVLQTSSVPFRLI